VGMLDGSSSKLGGAADNDSSKLGGATDDFPVEPRQVGGCSGWLAVPTLGPHCLHSCLPGSLPSPTAAF